MKKIENLTPEQEAKIPQYVEKYLAMGLSTRPTDRDKAEAAIHRYDKYQKSPPRKIFWAESPSKGAILAAQITKGDTEVTSEEIAATAGQASYGSFGAYWVSFYSFIGYELPTKKDELVDIANEIAEECGVFWTFKECVVLTPKPKAIHMKDKKLHNENGLALEYADGSGIFAIDGVRYPSLMSMTIQKHLGAGK